MDRWAGGENDRDAGAASWLVVVLGALLALATWGRCFVLALEAWGSGVASGAGVLIALWTLLGVVGLLAACGMARDDRANVGGAAVLWIAAGGVMTYLLAPA